MDKEEQNAIGGDCEKPAVHARKNRPARWWLILIGAAVCALLLLDGFFLRRGTSGTPEGGQTGSDRPVVYNETSRMPETEVAYRSDVSATLITSDELTQILPEVWPEEAPPYLWGSVKRYSWGDVAEVYLGFLCNDWSSGLITVTLHPEESRESFPLPEVSDAVAAVVEGQEVTFYRFRPESGGEYLYAFFNCHGTNYRIDTNVLSEQNEEAAERDFFQTAVCLLRSARDVDFTSWSRIVTSATR
ncbi:MAG: hypothetical protein IJT78_01240 [Oscillospiraceae bacterium]|nr:hypothetical protein [Oscillospiraceae bacterium]